MFNRWEKHDQWDDVATRLVDGDGMKFHRQYVQDVQPGIDHNTQVRNETNGWLPDRSARKCGSIPVTIVYDKIREWHADGRLQRGDPSYSLQLNELLKDMLRDRDYSKFRTTEKI